MRYLWCCLVMLPLLLLPVLAAQPSVTVNGSVIRGVETQVNNTTVEEYLGIRYGQPPTGSLRFSKPKPQSLPPELNATQPGSPCPQQLSMHSEDCLFLNVYVPVTGGDSLKPVMVWIHGGGFVLGWGHIFKGSRLAAEGDVIVVTINYRLGPFGFLSVGDNSSVGNYGLWDQRLALIWVRDNIQPFGGNPSLITMIGQSAGAGSIAYQMTSPQSSNLFHRAILQSGCRLCPWAYNATFPPQSAANQLAVVLQCNTSDGDSARLMECLRGKNFTLITTAGVNITGWVPVVDGDFILSYNLDQHQRFSGPIMSGINNYEGGGMPVVLSMFSTKDLTNRTFYREVVLSYLLDQVYHSIVTSSDVKALKEAADVLDCVYRGEMSKELVVDVTELESVVGDAYFFVCNQQFLDSQPSMGDAFLYYFDHYPKVPGAEKGMNHGMDTSYTFGFDQLGGYDPSNPFNGQNISSDDLTLGVRFRTFLTNFAKSGSPKQGSELPGWPDWPPYSRENKSYFAVTNSPAVRSHLKKEKMTIWIETIPSLLKSQGPAHLEDTPWGSCYKNQAGSANSNFTPKAYFLHSLLFIATWLVL